MSGSAYWPGNTGLLDTVAALSVHFLTTLEPSFSVAVISTAWSLVASSTPAMEYPSSDRVPKGCPSMVIVTGTSLRLSVKLAGDSASLSEASLFTVGVMVPASASTLAYSAVWSSVPTSLEGSEGTVPTTADFTFTSPSMSRMERA